MCGIGQHDESREAWIPSISGVGATRSYDDCARQAAPRIYAR